MVGGILRVGGALAGVSNPAVAIDPSAVASNLCHAIDPSAIIDAQTACLFQGGSRLGITWLGNTRPSRSGDLIHRSGISRERPMGWELGEENWDGGFSSRLPDFRALNPVLRVFLS